MENNPDTDNNNSGGRQSGSGSQGNIQVDTREISPQGRYIRVSSYYIRDNTYILISCSIISWKISLEQVPTKMCKFSSRNIFQ